MSTKYFVDQCGCELLKDGGGLRVNLCDSHIAPLELFDVHAHVDFVLGHLTRKGTVDVGHNNNETDTLDYIRAVLAKVEP